MRKAAAACLIIAILLTAAVPVSVSVLLCRGSSRPNERGVILAISIFAGGRIPSP